MTSAQAEGLGTQPKVVESGIIADYTGADISARDIGSYNSVHGNVTVTHNHHQEASGVSSKIAQWLRKPSINYKSIQEETRVMRTPNTIRWFFESKEYILWVEDGAGGNQNLQCIGMPGAGKTVLASAIIEDLERRFQEDGSSKPRVVLYIYFKHDRKTIQTTPIVLANLLSQLIQMKEPPSGYALRFYHEYQAHSDVAPGQDKIMTTLESEISTNATTYIVIDALDEFAPEDFSSALALVKDLERLDVKLLVTSRYVFSFIRDRSLKIEVSASEEDITLYIEERISSSARLGKFIERSPELRSEILVKVTEKSQGMFISTRFIMDWICGFLKPSDVKNALQHVPTGTDAMYELTMARVEDQLGGLRTLGMSALSWVLLAKRRLCVRELQHVVAFELQDGNRMVNDDDLYEMEDIISACMGLIVCVKDEVQFVHFSTQEFLTDNCDRYFPNAKLRVMETCLRYLIILAPLMPEDRRAGDTKGRPMPGRIFRVKNPYERATEYFRPFPFANYASSHWGPHASDIDGHERLNVELIDTFFSHPLSPYLVSADFPLPRITQTKKMSTATYKILFFSTFGLCSLLKRCIENTNDQDGEGSTKVNLDVCDERAQTPLFFATTHNRSTAVQLLLNAGADVTVAAQRNRTCLHEAASDGRLDIIAMLLQHGAAIDARDSQGESAIFHAMQKNELGAVELLCEKGADISTPNKNGQTLLHRAAYEGLSDIVTILLEKGVEINSVDEDGRTPIWTAVDGSNREMVNLLIENGANISEPDNSGQTLLHRAAYWGQSDTTTTLLEKGMDINSLDGDGCTPIWTAVNRREGGMVRLLIEKGANIGIPDKRGQTLLHRAVYHGLLEIAAILLEKGVAIDSFDESGRTPIWTAFNIDKEQWEMVTLLIEKGANISIPDKSGQTLLHRAAYRGQSDIVIMLLKDSRCDVNQADNKGRTPIFLAARGRHPGIIQLLLEKGGDASTANHSGETPLHCAARKGRIPVVIALLHDPHIDINAKDISGRTPLLTAMEYKNYTAAAVLIENGVNTTDLAAQTLFSEKLNDVLRWAAYRGCSRAIELLMTMGADLGGTDQDGDDIIAYAAAGHALEALKLLLNQGIVDIDKPNRGNKAPIHHAIRPWITRKDVPDSERVAVFRILLEMGADIHRVDEDNETPLLLARECKWPDIRDLVEQHAIRLQQSEAHIQDGGAVVDGVVGDGGKEEEPVSHPGHGQDDTSDSSVDEGDLGAALLDGDTQEAKETEQELEAVVEEAIEVDLDDRGGRITNADAGGVSGLALEDAESGRKESEELEDAGSMTEETPGCRVHEAQEVLGGEEKKTMASISLQDATSESRQLQFSPERMLNVILIVIIAILAYIVGRSSEKA